MGRIERKDLVPFGLFAMATALFYPEILLPGWILADYDVWVYFYPLRTYAAEALRAGRFPLWNPDTFLGAPFFANPQTALLYPGTALFHIVPVPYAYSLSILLHVFLAALFMYAFLRWSVAVAAMPAIVGASAFAFGGFLSSQVGHINQLSASAWLPAIALCTDFAARRRSVPWALAGAATLSVQLLAGHAQESYMTLWVVALVLLWRVFDDAPSDQEGTAGRAPTTGNGPRGPRRTSMGGDASRPAAFSLAPEPRRWRLGLSRFAGRGASAVLAGATVASLGFGLAAIQLLPAAELGAHSVRGRGMSFLEATSFSMPPTELFRSLLPGYWFNPTGENIGYIGGVGLAFALLGFVFGRRGAAAFGGAAVALGLFLALGGANPFYRLLLENVPGLGLFRVPARWLFVYSFGAATLVGLGADWVLARRALRSGGAQPPPDPSDVAAALGAGPLRTVIAVVALVLLLWVGSVFPPGVPGRIAALWVGALGLGFGLAVAGFWVPGRIVGGLIVVALLVELRWGAMDLPQRYAIPASAVASPRAVPAYLRAQAGDGRILSIAPVEYELEDHAELEARFAPLEEGSLFDLKSALKLDEVMSPNVPLRYGLSTLDGYDGGVLPLRRYLTIASLLVPPEELRPDGVLRTRMIAVPSERSLRLFGIDAIVAGRVSDVELDGIHFDVATARELRDGESLTVPLPQPVPAKEVALLGSVVGPSAGVSEGRMILSRTDGSREEILLRVGHEVFLESAPGPHDAPQPTAGLSRGDRRDSGVRLVVPAGDPVAKIEWAWQGPSPWVLRAATVVAADGTQDPLVLQPNLERLIFPNLKVYRPKAARSGTPLVPRAEVHDDEAAMRLIASQGPGFLDDVVLLAPGQGLPATGEKSSPADRGTSVTGAGPSSLFERLSGQPERIEYRRVSGESGGYLVVDDAWFPGWHAKVDGQDVPLHRANVHFKAVEVPPGARSVVLTFQSASVALGALVSLASAFVVVAALALGALWRRFFLQGG